MIILDATTRSLEIDLNAAVAANQLPFVASYVDINQSTFAMSAMSTNTGASNSTTAVTLVAAPGATTSRQLKYLSVKNSDTAAVLLWIQLNDNTTLREIWKGTLAVGDTLVYVDSLGFNVVDSSGGIKSSLVNTMSTLTLTSTLTMSGTAANIALGSNYISNGGTDAGLSLDASNNATLSGSIKAAGGLIAEDTTSVTVNGTGSDVMVGTVVNNAITSTTDLFVAYMASGHALNPSGVNGSLLLYSRNLANSEVVIATENAIRARFSSSTNTLSGTLTVSGGTVTHTGLAFASLPTAVAGMVAYVTDSNTATWGATAAGGGANKVLVWYNGTNWTVAGA